MSDIETGGSAETGKEVRESAPRACSCLRAEKQAIRREKIAMRKALAPEARIQADAGINRKLLEIIQSGAWKAVTAYVSDGSEPDLTPVMRYVLEHGMRLCLPRFESDGKYSIVEVKTLDFPKSHWGIPEPSAEAPAAPADVLAKALWLVPGVAFDESCRRLGRGKGIYDRLLAQGTGKTIGIFYELQRSPELPHEATDCPTDSVVTERGLFGYKTQC